MKDNFGTQNDPTPMPVDAEMLNKLGKTMQATSKDRQAGCGANTHASTFKTTEPPTDNVQGFVVIRADSLTQDECEAAYDDDTAPCLFRDGAISDSVTGRYDGTNLPVKLAGRLVGRFRYWDSSFNNWVEYAEDVQVDLGGYWEGYLYAGEAGALNSQYDSEASVHPSHRTQRSNDQIAHGYGAVQIPLAGQPLFGFWSDQRGMFIPILEPPSQRMYAAAQNPSVSPYGFTTGDKDCLTGPAATRNSWCEATLCQSSVIQGRLEKVVLDSIAWYIPDRECGCVGLFGRDGQRSTRSSFVTAMVTEPSTLFTIEFRAAAGMTVGYSTVLKRTNISIRMVGRANINSFYDYTLTPTESACDVSDAGFTRIQSWLRQGTIEDRYHDAPSSRDGTPGTLYRGLQLTHGTSQLVRINWQATVNL